MHFRNLYGDEIGLGRYGGTNGMDPISQLVRRDILDEQLERPFDRLKSESTSTLMVLCGKYRIDALVCANIQEDKGPI
jgi:hypothetical protein